MLKSCEIDFNNPPAKAQEIIRRVTFHWEHRGTCAASLAEREQGKVTMWLHWWQVQSVRRIFRLIRWVSM